MSNLIPISLFLNLFIFPFSSLSETDPVEKFVRAQLEVMPELVESCVVLYHRY